MLGDYEVGADSTGRTMEALEKAGEVVTIQNIGLRKNDGDKLKSIADPMADVFGSGIDSNPAEIAELRKELDDLGVKLTQHSGEALGYCPGLRSGEPGMAYISLGASYSAWLHEMQHVRDDRDAGWLGMSVIADPDMRFEWEVRAYDVEIELAIKAGRFDIADKLRKNLEEERKIIYDE